MQGPAVTDLTKAREQRADASREVGRLAVEGGVEERGIRAAAAAPLDDVDPPSERAPAAAVLETPALVSLCLCNLVRADPPLPRGATPMPGAR